MPSENTITVDPTPEAEVAGEVAGVQLTAEEQDSLQVGEKIQDAQESLLAGKYENAQELEKAYIELQKKIGSKDEPEAEPESESETTESDEAPTYSEGATLINDASNEFYSNDGKISPETLEKFSSMSSQDLVNAYLEVQASLPQNQDQSVADIADAQVNEVKNSVGGDDAYNNLVQWAGNNLDQQSIDAFDSIVNSGSVEAIKIAVRGLKAEYENANGYEGRMYTGKPPSNTGDVFRSQAELVKAMSDRRYDDDPAYRQDVIAKLDRSDNLQF
tara:strand:- start:1028 stop:1849 length:822 start_codon:yes stop_codon:yes gene_type:complete